MTKWIIGAVVGGILAGYFFVPEALPPTVAPLLPWDSV